MRRIPFSYRTWNSHITYITIVLHTSVQSEEDTIFKVYSRSKNKRKSRIKIVCTKTVWKYFVFKLWLPKGFTLISSPMVKLCHIEIPWKKYLGQGFLIWKFFLIICNIVPITLFFITNSNKLYKKHNFLGLEWKKIIVLTMN